MLDDVREKKGSRLVQAGKPSLLLQKTLNWSALPSPYQIKYRDNREPAPHLQSRETSIWIVYSRNGSPLFTAVCISS